MYDWVHHTDNTRIICKYPWVYVLNALMFITTRTSGF